MPLPVPPPEAQAGAHFMRARLLEVNGQLREAAESYEQAALLDPDSSLLQRHLAEVWARIGELDRATAHAERALELDPEDIQVRQGLAAVYASAGRFEDASFLLEEALEQDRLKPEGYLVLFNLYLQSGKLQDARAVAEILIERRPDAVRGYLALGAAAERLEDAAGAERAYRDALELKPGQPSPLYDAIARLYRRADDGPGELAIWEEKLAAVPGDPAALHRIAQLRDAAGDRQGAVEALEELVARTPDDLNARIQLGFFYYQNDRLDDAIAEFRAVAERNSRLDEVLYYLGVVYAAAGQHQEALDALGAVPSTADRFADSRFRMARVLDLEERFDEALEQIERAIAASDKGDLVSLKVYHAGLKRRAGDSDGALELMSALVEAHPGNPNLLYDLGVVYGEMGDEERALELMKQVIEIDPEHASGLNYLGYTWAERGIHLAEAEELVRRAVELRPDDGYVTDSLGWVLYKRGLAELAKGRVTESRRSLRQSVEVLELAIEMIDPDDPLITRHLADAYRAVFRLNDALAAYRRALELGPKTEDALDIRRQIDLIELQLSSSRTEIAR
ncbi:MAG: tetratricopeptide repeat protein [Myxococcales bacterium]|nr:tetratricopeptide repeat protein [Myxococcales bacterium]